MRSILAALLLVGSASWASAGVLVELTDGTKLTVENHWIDGDQVHLVRGGVDMIVPKSRIKAMDENVADPEVHRDRGGGDAPAAKEGAAETASTPAGDQGFERPLGEMTVGELQQLHKEESQKLLELQDKRFGALYGGEADQKTRDAAEAAFQQQNRRNAKVRFALDRAQKAAAGDEPPAPAAPRVEQPQ